MRKIIGAAASGRAAHRGGREAATVGVEVRMAPSALATRLLVQATTT